MEREDQSHKDSSSPVQAQNEKEESCLFHKEILFQSIV
jgi:hypothetical protein